MADLTSTRRGILGAMAIAPMVIAAPAAGLTSGFAAKMTAYRAATRALDDFSEKVCNPAYDRWKRLAAAVPHTSVTWGKETWSTADGNRVAEARYFLDPKHKVAMQAEQSEYHAACVTLVAASDERQAIVAQISSACGLDAANQHSDALCVAMCNALDAVVEHPVSTSAELGEKLTLLAKLDEQDWANAREAIAADVERLAGSRQ